ncbi:NAD(P)/FAD-dependent oxidoreductase [Jatrophihabitans sp.]|uniref:flavin-containing monooxygenase n=1 Tax=Jatrophihabitans sp. TaxID=1932789 RepID=UPI0030C7159A|nr:NAD(P)/FAD-dependent oxidoreductase [Jatrophihabitans sp.]
MTQTGAEHVEGTARHTDFDVILIGAGLTGIYQLIKLRETGLRVRCFEGGGGVGGTWYWNRYPGARLDSESYTYQYSFAEEMLAEWDWTQEFAGQPELETYFNRVVDQYDLRKDIQLNTPIDSMTFDEQSNNWTVTTRGGEQFTSHLVVTATGILSAPLYPDTPGLENYQGEVYHTATWPDTEVEFAGKKVIIFGTGATGVQLITEVAKQDVEKLTIFQRTANWAIPLRNHDLSADEMSNIRAGYQELFPWLRTTFSGFVHNWDPTPTTAYTPEELLARYELAWSRPGFAKWTGLPLDVGTDPEVNQGWCDFVAGKIRERVTDPKVADMLIPDHLYGTKRVPCESGYYESFNQDNVELISLQENPVLEYTATGVRTAQGDIDADMICFATGFYAFTGALDRIDITGQGGRKLKDEWEDGPVTFMGVQVDGFPNLLINGGPHGKGGHGNSTRCSEPVVEWTADLVKYIFDNNIARVEPDPEAQRRWTDHVYEVANGTLMSRTKSFFFGDNVPGKKRAYLAYVGALPAFVNDLQAMAADGYPDLIFTK